MCLCAFCFLVILQENFLVSQQAIFGWKGIDSVLEEAIRDLTGLKFLQVSFI